MIIFYKILLSLDDCGWETDRSVVNVYQPANNTQRPATERPWYRKPTTSSVSVQPEPKNTEEMKQK